MWVLIWATLLLSLTERATCKRQQQPSPRTASPWTIAFSPAKITGEKGLCAVISCTFNHAKNFNPTAAMWLKCKKNGNCDPDEDIIIHSETPSKAQEGYKQRVSLLETDLTKKNCSVIINDIRENDTGEYQFRLLNANTYPKKVKITVKGQDVVTGKTPIQALTQKPSVLTPPLTEGEPATLTCTAPGICSGTPPKITWTWRGTGDNITELRDNTTIQMREDLTNVTTTHFSTLTFTPLADHHNMMVTCQVTFQKTYAIEETVTLNVSYVKDPQITGNKMVKEDGTLDLTCSVDSYPPSDITWSKNGTSAPLQNYTENATLTISNVTREHAGEYVCTVHHHNRTMTASTIVTVMYLPVILPGSGCVDQAEVMTCVCVSQGVPLPLIEWPLLELNTENTTSVLGSSVNSTLSLLVGNYNNITVECVSRNVVGVVREKLQVTQNKSQEKQEDKEWEDIIAMLSDLKLITAFVIGAALSATICCIFLCLTGKCKRQKKTIPKDSKNPLMNLEMVACEDQQTDAGRAVRGEQTPLQLELRGGAENGGPQTSGAAGKFDTREDPNEVDYASINYSLLKKKTPEEAEKKTTTTESEYAKIKREKKKEGDEDGGEGSGVMMGKDEEKENGKPAAETDEDTVLYSNVKAIMGGGE
ncbi:sialic acid-binding Ig-like lectin 5 isoform X1 [Salmo salar]|uniref:B-cell receptor CD22 n=1 Tax=Salmo salar TaxID=8030 RepID=A0A1S3RUS9_SALSA|nr:sialic acid-binding Ig-like lectin 5 isoform X1 [Salmo salar]